jgi:pyruvate/2-oxoglutarate dehydrogenase complex dihydrolipoamide acyltransferase (E2) component
MRVLIVSALVVAGLILFGCQKKSEEAPAPEAQAEAAPAPAPEAEAEAAPAEEEPAAPEAKQLTEDLWVEIKAHEHAALPTGEELKKLGPEAVSKARDEVYKKYGVTHEDMDSFFNKLSDTDSAKAGELAKRAADKAQKLRQK